jgi:hypothetical protein
MFMMLYHKEHLCDLQQSPLKNITFDGNEWAKARMKMGIVRMLSHS